MPRLSDLPLVIRRVGFWSFVKRVWTEVGDDHLLTWGAALAYSWLFAVFPFMIFLLTLIPYLPETLIPEAGKHVELFLYTWLSENSAYTLWENIKGALSRPRTGLMSVGLLVTVWAASGGVNMTMTALDRCYEVEKGRSFLKRRMIAIAITLAVASLILLVMILIPVGNLATKLTLEYWHEKQWYLPRGIVWAWNGARYLLALVLCFTVIAIMYRFGICVRQRFRLFTPGSVFTIGVWILLTVGFRWYANSFGKEGYNRTYGTVGGVAVLLLFFYLDALVLMIGAEINSEIDYELLGVPRGSLDFTVAAQPMFAEMSQPVSAGTAVGGMAAEGGDGEAVGAGKSGAG